MLENIVGLIPAAGQASRIAPLPISKELFPVGFSDLAGVGGSHRPKVAAHYLLEKMRSAGAQKAFIVLRNGKWDIPAYFGDGAMLNMHLAYLLINQSWGVPYTLDQAYPFIRSATIVFGFADILFFPEAAYQLLIEHLFNAKADIALGLFKAQRTEKMDMVALDKNKYISDIIIKPQQTQLTHTWIIAAWQPSFTEFMHYFLKKDVKNRAHRSQKDELHLGDIFRAAIASKLQTAVVCFDSGRYLDIGTPEDLVMAQHFVETAK